MIYHCSSVIIIIIIFLFRSFFAKHSTNNELVYNIFPIRVLLRISDSFCYSMPRARRNIISGGKEKHKIYLPHNREHVVEKEYTKPLRNNIIFIWFLNNSRFSPRVYSIVRAVQPKNRFETLSFPRGL